MGRAIIFLFGIFIILLIIFSGLVDNVSPVNSEVFFPEPTNYVVDATATLKPETITSLNAMLKEYSNKAELAVVITPSLGGLSLEEYCIKLSEKWKGGKHYDKDGLILFIAKEYCKVRIKVGKGLEGDIPDAVAGRILDNVIVPALKAGDWDKAIKDGITAIQGEIE